MASNASYTINDYDSQAGIVGIQIPEVSDTNFVDVATKIGELRTTMTPLIRGIFIQTQMSIISRYNASDEPATDDLAQRGNKWRVVYRDTSQWADAPTNTVPNYGYLKTFDVEIPTANLTLREGNSDVIYTKAGGGVGAAAAAIAAFVADFEELVVSPYGGVPDVLRIEAVTRTGG